MKLLRNKLQIIAIIRLKLFFFYLYLLRLTQKYLTHVGYIFLYFPIYKYFIKILH